MIWHACFVFVGYGFVLAHRLVYNLSGDRPKGLDICGVARL